MKKILFLILLLVIFFIKFPPTVSAVDCCPVGTSYHATNNRCFTANTHVYIDSNCTEDQTCEDNQCVDYKNRNPVEEENKVLCPDENSINTAIGCIPISDTNEFIAFILRWAIGIGGGIAFLLIIFAGFQIMTSAGNPERLQAGRELLTSAVAGLILLVFSVFILRIIGVDILKLPGFGG